MRDPDTNTLKTWLKSYIDNPACVGFQAAAYDPEGTFSRSGVLLSVGLIFPENVEDEGGFHLNYRGMPTPFREGTSTHFEGFYIGDDRFLRGLYRSRFFGTWTKHQCPETDSYQFLLMKPDELEKKFTPYLNIHIAPIRGFDRP
jgi:hypothetical protein